MTTRARVRLLLQDGLLTDDGAPATATEILELPPLPPDGFLDGPACRRLAVVDFDPDTGDPMPPPARLRRPRPGRVTGGYVARGGPDSASSLAINAFGTAFQTVRMFERPLGLGRPVRWAFPGEQLLVVPRAGEWHNAFYERSTRSLQFFSFEHEGRLVHTARSRDIVAHETGHALLDGVAPWLHDNLGPQSIATHEAVADLVAVLVAIDTDPLRERVLAAAENDLAGDNAFARIAEEFGRARSGPGLPERHALRDLHNELTLADVDRTRPHELSVVLSGLLYDTLAATYASMRDAAAATAASPAAAANRALGSAGQLVQRLLIQGLDLLPPGEVGFADVGRAMLAADRALRPDNDRLVRHRRALAERFVSRGIVADAADLDGPSADDLSVPVGEVPALRDSDWAAYRYVDAHRAALGIPADAVVRVLPRLDAVKQYGARDSATGRRAAQRQLIVKVAWDVLEPLSDPLLEGMVRRRRIGTGATVALRWADGVAVALVRGGAAASAEGRTERDAMLGRLLGQGSGEDAGGVRVIDTDGVLRVRGTQTLLHLAEVAP